MRGIKFKFWIEKSKYMTDEVTLENIFYFKDQVLKNKTILFTGFKDKNSKNIYDGDIFKCNYEIYEVFFDKGSWLATSIKNYYKEQNYYLSFFDIKKIEVIGNIYENPELL